MLKPLKNSLSNTHLYSILNVSHCVVRTKLDFYMNVICIVNDLNHYSCLPELK